MYAFDSIEMELYEQEIKNKKMADSEYGTCPYCGTTGNIQRTYFHYDIKCVCHSPKHFEIVWHCHGCVPVEPTTTKIHINTEDLKRVTGM